VTADGYEVSFRGEEEPCFQKQNKAFQWDSINSGNFVQELQLESKGANAEVCPSSLM